MIKKGKFSYIIGDLQPLARVPVREVIYWTTLFLVSVIFLQKDPERIFLQKDPELWNWSSVKKEENQKYTTQPNSESGP